MIMRFVLIEFELCMQQDTKNALKTSTLKITSSGLMSSRSPSTLLSRFFSMSLITGSRSTNFVCDEGDNFEKPA